MHSDHEKSPTTKKAKPGLTLNVNKIKLDKVAAAADDNADALDEAEEPAE